MKGKKMTEGNAHLVLPQLKKEQVLALFFNHVYLLPPLALDLFDRSFWFLAFRVSYL
jgi:hypothetical protein